MRGIEFVNDLNCNYLTIPYEGGEDSFALRMMTENVSEAFLPMELRRLDGQTYLYYNISGMQNMEILYGEKPIDRKTFQEFIRQLSRAMEESGELFLPGDGICLEPEALFKELGTGRWKFLYIPEREAGKPEKMQGERESFAEFLVTHMDCEDKELMETVYRFYEEICAGVGFPWGDGEEGLTRCIFDRTVGEAVSAKERGLRGTEEPERVEPWQTEAGHMEMGRVEPGYMEAERMEPRRAETGRVEMRNAETEEEAEWGAADSGGKRKLPIILLCVLLCAAGILTLVSGRIMPNLLPYGAAAFGLLAVILFVMWRKMGKKKERCEEEEYGVEYVTEYAKDTAPPEFFYPSTDGEAECAAGFVAEERTVYMDIGERLERKLYGVGKYRRHKIFLERFPCLAGKDKTLADHVIADPSVSRMHVKFSMEGETVWMQDLNSTNGTYHNGMRLKPNERVALEPEDEVGFGQVQFVFR